VVVWDNRNTHVSRAMADVIAVREAAPFLGDAWFYRTLAALGGGESRLTETQAGEALPAARRVTPRSLER